MDDLFDEDDFFSDDNTDEVNGSFLDTNDNLSDTLTMQDLVSSNNNQSTQQQDISDQQQIGNQTQFANQQTNQQFAQQQFGNRQQVNRGQQSFVNNQNNTENQSINEYWQQQQVFGQSSGANEPNGLQNNLQNTARQINLNKWQVGTLVSSIIIVIAIIALSIHNYSGKVKNQPTVKTKTEQSTVSENSTLRTNVSSKSSVVLTEIPQDTKMSMSKDVIEATGTVSDFNRYLLGNQVVYCIYVQLQTNSGVKDVKYFCNFASYKSVNEGSKVKVRYQLIDGKYISVLEMLNN